MKNRFTSSEAFDKSKQTSCFDFPEYEGAMMWFSFEFAETEPEIRALARIAFTLLKYFSNPRDVTSASNYGYGVLLHIFLLLLCTHLLVLFLNMRFNVDSGIEKRVPTSGFDLVPPSPR